MGKRLSPEEIQVEVDRNVELAKALGWPSDQIRVIEGEVIVGPPPYVRCFNYRNRSLLWDLAVAYDAFPSRSASTTEKEWMASSGKVKKIVTFRSVDPEYAVYQAVLHAAKHTKLSVIKS